VVRTRVGYAGGTTDDPTYRNISDHTETLQIDYDPTVTSYQELLEVFWESHTPTLHIWSRQYMAAIFTHDAEQARLAEESREKIADRESEKIRTQILPLTGFWRAEDYHQKHRLRGDDLVLSELEARFPDPAAFTDSPVVSRVNGYLGGYGTLEQLEKEIASFELSPEAEKRLRERVGQ
jgi:methionine-S-sulfoxide reductase